MNRVIGLFLLLVSIPAWALEITGVEAQLKSQGFESNLATMEHDHDAFYEAYKVQAEKWRGVTVAAFTEGKGSTRVKQVRWTALNCTFSKNSDAAVLEASHNELAKAFRPLFGVELPKELETLMAQSEVNKEFVLSEKGFKKIKFLRSPGYCDSNKGGITYVIDFYLKPGAGTTPLAVPSGS
jgi:hypothetical protein